MFDDILKEAMQSKDVKDVLIEHTKETVVGVLKGIIKALEQSKQSAITIEQLQSIVDRYTKETSGHGEDMDVK